MSTTSWYVKIEVFGLIKGENISNIHRLVKNEGGAGREDERLHEISENCRLLFLRKRVIKKYVNRKEQKHLNFDQRISSSKKSKKIVFGTLPNNHNSSHKNEVRDLKFDIGNSNVIL